MIHDATPTIQVVEFICNLLLDYNVYSDLILWDSLLNKLIELGRYRMLMTVFERVPHDLYAIEGIAGILNKTVEGTIAALALDLDVDLAERLLQLFQQCPILSALDATAAMNYFTEILLDADIELGMKGIGALLPLVTDKETATGKLRQELGSLAKRDFGTLLDTIEHGYTSFGLYQNGFEVA